MDAVITLYAPAGEIGGNKILAEDNHVGPEALGAKWPLVPKGRRGNTWIMLDFGLSYAKYNRFYIGFRRSQGRA